MDDLDWFPPDGSREGQPCEQRHNSAMSFCDHCDGQRFDRARVLRELRAARKRLRSSTAADQALAAAIEAVRTLDIPHLERLDDAVEGEIIH